MDEVVIKMKRGCEVFETMIGRVVSCVHYPTCGMVEKNVKGSEFGHI
jgi:hypothetical protein